MCIQAEWGGYFNRFPLARREDSTAHAHGADVEPLPRMRKYPPIKNMNFRAAYDGLSQVGFAHALMRAAGVGVSV